MTRLIARYVTTLLVALSILAPLGGGAMAGLGLSGDRVIVICTGDGLRMLRLGPDGVPQEVSETEEPCALLHAAGTALAARAEAPAPRLVFALPPLPGRQISAMRPGNPSSLPRAPPVA